MCKWFLLFFLLGGCLREITYPGPLGLGIFPREKAKKKGQLSPPPRGFTLSIIPTAEKC